MTTTSKNGSFMPKTMSVVLAPFRVSTEGSYPSRKLSVNWRHFTKSTTEWMLTITVTGCHQQVCSTQVFTRHAPTSSLLIINNSCFTKRTMMNVHRWPLSLGLTQGPSIRRRLRIRSWVWKPSLPVGRCFLPK